MSNLVSLPIALCSVCLSACCALIPSEATVSVTGTIAYEPKEPCNLNFYSEHGGQTMHSRLVAGTFDEKFSFTPGTTVYLVQITCDGEQLESRSVYFGRDVNDGGVIALGNIAQ